MANQLYNVVRFYSDENRDSRIVKRNVTIQQARAHCSRADTCQEGVWFDGFTKA